MSKSNTTENDVIDCIIRGIDPSYRANASRYIALYTADPGEAGTAITNESAYGSYARVLVDADTGFSAASSGSSQNTGLIQFPECSSGSETITHFGIVTTASGAGQLLYSAALSSSRSVSAGIQPQFSAGSLTINED
jgi:hypothetical protein